MTRKDDPVTLVCPPGFPRACNAVTVLSGNPPVPVLPRKFTGFCYGGRIISY